MNLIFYYTFLLCFVFCINVKITDSNLSLQQSEFDVISQFLKVKNHEIKCDVKNLVNMGTNPILNSFEGALTACLGEVKCTGVSGTLKEGFLLCKKFEVLNESHSNSYILPFRLSTNYSETLRNARMNSNLKLGYCVEDDTTLKSNSVDAILTELDELPNEKILLVQVSTDKNNFLLWEAQLCKKTNNINDYIKEPGFLIISKYIK